MQRGDPTIDDFTIFEEDGRVTTQDVRYPAEIEKVHVYYLIHNVIMKRKNNNNGNELGVGI